MRPGKSCVLSAGASARVVTAASNAGARRPTSVRARRPPTRRARGGARSGRGSPVKPPTVAQKGARSRSSWGSTVTVITTTPSMPPATGGDRVGVAVPRRSRSWPHLSEHFRGRHPRADPLELLDRHAVEAVLAAGLLDGPDDHSPDERGIFFIRAAAASSQGMVGGDSGPYSIAGGPSGPAPAARPRIARRGDPAKVPGVCVQRGSSAIRSPVIP